MSAGSWPSCCFLLLENRSMADGVTLLNGAFEPGAAMASEQEAASIAATWPSIGPGPQGWSLIVDPHFEFGDDDFGPLCAPGAGRILRLIVIPEQMYSEACGWNAERLQWDVSYEAELDDEALIGGDFPLDAMELATPSGGAPEPAEWFRVPVAAVERITGWRPGQARDRGFTRFTYPRPVGVARQVTEDLAAL